MAVYKKATEICKKRTKCVFSLSYILFLQQNDFILLSLQHPLIIIHADNHFYSARFY